MSPAIALSRRPPAPLSDACEADATPWVNGVPPEIVLDLSRLLSRVLHSTPTGVDRVEMAYAQALMALMPERTHFSLTHPSGLSGCISGSAAADFIALTADRWERGDEDKSAIGRWRRAIDACLRLRPALTAPRRGAGRRAYLHLSARSLERTDMVRTIMRRERAGFFPFVHDLIPLAHPEYARPNGTALYRRKLQTVVALADGVLVNSQATADALEPLLLSAGRATPIHVAPLGVPSSHCGRAPGPSAAPYFVVLGTIEPRKNHLMLLQLWRRLVETTGPAATPKLFLVGRRGWENEMVLDLLDRCPALRPVVEERGRLSDAAQRDLIRGARALLLPSFAEGYGLPVVEALALGVPVIASDLSALREAGGAAPDYLDPLDTAAWLRAITDYTRPISVLRSAQLARMTAWSAPSWNTHVRDALGFIDRVLQ